MMIVKKFKDTYAFPTRTLGTRKEITCTDPYVLDYARLREKLVAMGGINQLTGNLADRYINHISADWMKYIFDTYCDYNLTGGFDTRFGTGPSRYAEGPLTIQYGQILLKNKNTTTSDGVNETDRVE